MTSFAKAYKFAQAFRTALFLPVLPVIWVVMSGFGILSGAFGTAHLSLFGRFVFWPIIIAFGILIGAALRVIVRDYLGLRRYAVEAPLIAALATLILTPLCTWLADVLIEEERFRPGWAEVASYVYLVSMAVSTLRHALAAGWHRDFTPDLGADGGALPVADPPVRPTDLPQVPAKAVAAAPKPEPAERLMARIDATLRAPLVRLQVRDHYVEVVTEAGMESVLIRLADAIAETEGVEGLQVHRSHWVARAAIRGLYRGRGKLVLRMSDGAVVPVSRTYAPGVQVLGLEEQTSAPQEEAGPRTERAEAG